MQVNCYALNAHILQMNAARFVYVLLYFKIIYNYLLFDDVTKKPNNEYIFLELHKKITRINQ